MRIFRSIVVTLLFIAYPLLVYWAVTHGVSWFIPLIMSVVFLHKFYRSAYKQWGFFFLAIFLFSGALFFQTVSAKVLPVFIYTGLFFVFYSSLKTDRPLIERFARLDFPELPPNIPEYCRQVTWLWTIFFALNIAVCSALAIWASDAFWALYTGVISYLLLGLLMTGEYIFRRLRFPWLEVAPFKESMMNMIKNGHTVWDYKER